MKKLFLISSLTSIALILIAAQIAVMKPSLAMASEGNVHTINNKPTVSDVDVNGLEDVETFYDPEDTLNAFYDPDDDALAKIKIVSLPAVGTLSLSGVPVVINQEVVPADLANLSYSSPPNWNGVVYITWNGSDGIDYAEQDATAIVTIEAVNDAPSFSGGADLDLGVNAGPQYFPGWASAITPGAVDEASQVLTFAIKTDNDTLFAVKPAIDPGTGDLNFTAASNKIGTALVTVTLKDDGGTENGGVDSSAPQSFKITIHQNRPPDVDDFTKHQKENQDIQFLSEDFENKFTDPDGDTMVKVKIVSLPAHGTLSLNGLEVVAGQEVNRDKLDKLVFTPNVSWTGVTVFTWNGSDGKSYAESDGTVTLSISGTDEIMTFIPVIVGPN